MGVEKDDDEEEDEREDTEEKEEGGFGNIIILRFKRSRRPCPLLPTPHLGPPGRTI